MLWSCTGVSHTQGVGNSSSPRNTFPEVFPEFCPSFQVSSPARAAFQESPGGQLLCQVHCKKAPHRCIPTSIDSLHWQRWKRQRLIHWWWQAAGWLETENQKGYTEMRRNTLRASNCIEGFTNQIFQTIDINNTTVSNMSLYWSQNNVAHSLRKT